MIFISVYRTPTKFPGDLKAKRASQIVQSDHELWKRTPRIFQKEQNIIRTGQNFQKGQKIIRTGLIFQEEFSQERLQFSRRTYPQE